MNLRTINLSLQYVLRHLSSLTPLQVHVIRKSMLSDYGSVSLRCIHRNVEKGMSLGLIERVGVKNRSAYVITRKGIALLQDLEDFRGNFSGDAKGTANSS